MFPLLKYSSSIITFYFYCVHLLQINFTVNPITPIEYIPWQWSDQFKISWEKRLFSKVTHTLGKLYYASKFTYVQQKSVPTVCGLAVPCGSFSFTVARDGSWFRDQVFYVSIFMNMERENGLLTFFFFPKQLWHLPVDQGKNPITPNPSVPNQHHHILKRNPSHMVLPLFPSSRSAISNAVYL